MSAPEGFSDTLLSPGYWNTELIAAEAQTIHKARIHFSYKTAPARDAFASLSAEGAHFIREEVTSGQELPATDPQRLSLLRIVLDERHQQTASKLALNVDSEGKKIFDHRASQIETTRWFQGRSAEYEITGSGLITAIRRAVLYAKSSKDGRQLICVPASGIVKKDLIDDWQVTKGESPEPSFTLPLMRVGQTYRGQAGSDRHVLRVAKAELFTSYKNQGGHTNTRSLLNLWNAIRMAMAAEPAPIPIPEHKR